MRLICGQLLLQKIVRPSIKINVSLLKRAKGSIILIYQFLTWQNAVVKTAPTAPPLTNPYLGLFRKASQLPTMSQIFKTQNKNKTQLIIPASVQEVFFSSNEINKKGNQGDMRPPVVYMEIGSFWFLRRGAEYVNC